MKRTLQFLGIVAITVMIGLAFTTCEIGSTNGGGGNNNNVGGHNNAFIGQTLNLSGQVYARSWDANDRPVFTPFTGDLEIVGVGGSIGGGGDNGPGGGWWFDDRDEIGTGSITNGILNFTAGTPPAEVMDEVYEVFYIEDNMTISPANAMVALLNLEGVRRNGNIWRGNTTVNQDRTSGIWDGVEFIYVDRDVNIRADHFVWTNDECRDGECWNDCLEQGSSQCWCECWCVECSEETYTETWTAFNINLRRGWNAIHIRETETETATGWAYTITFSAGNPANLRWVLDGFRPPLDYIPTQFHGTWQPDWDSEYTLTITANTIQGSGPLHTIVEVREWGSNSIRLFTEESSVDLMLSGNQIHVWSTPLAGITSGWYSRSMIGDWETVIMEHNVLITVTDTSWTFSMPGVLFDQGTYTFNGHLAVLFSTEFDREVGTAELINDNTIRLILNQMSDFPGTYTLTRLQQTQVLVPSIEPLRQVPDRPGRNLPSWTFRARAR